MTDLTGRDLAFAERVLDAAGEAYRVVETRPVHHREDPEGFLRVIRQQNRDGIAVLTVCRIPDAYR